MEYIKIIIDMCYQILNYKIYLGMGYYISLFNVMIFGLIGFLLLVIFYKIFD